MANLLYIQEFGPKISKFQNLNQYKKVISEVSQTSEQRELQQKENFIKSKAQASNIMPQIVERKNINQSKQQHSLLTFIQRSSLVNIFVSNLFQNSYILPKKFKYLQVDDYIPQSQKLQNINCKFILRLDPSENIIKFKILKPDNKYLQYWDMYGLIINMISLWLSPFQTSFDLTSPKSLLYLIIIYLLLDILVNFNRSTIAKGEIIKNRSFIIKNYFKGNASFDFINLFIWLELLIYDDEKILQEILQFIQLIILIKKLLTSCNNFFESLYSKATNTGLTDLGFLIIAVYFFAHIMACLWFYVGKKSESFYQISWLQKFNIENQNILIQYNYSIYWAITTIVTVGYGDIIPQNSLEIQFVSIMMVISSLVYAYLLNQIGNILKNFYERKQQYKKMLFKLDNFLNKNDVDKELQLRAKNFLKYYVLNKEQKENSDEFKNILLLLPERLKNSIDVNVKQKQTEKISFLKELFSKNTIQEISKILEIIYLSPEEILYQQSEYSDSSLYYVYDGQIILYEKKSQKLLSTVNAGQKFGEFQFFTGQFPKYTAKSSTNSIIYKISREKLLQIISQNQTDFQKFNDIKDDILLNSNFQKCHTFCQNCQKQNHQTIDCPILLYKPNLEQRLKKSRFHDIQNFRQFQPRKNCKFGSLINQPSINSSIKIFQKINKKTYLANIQRQNFVDQHRNLNLENSFEASEDNCEEQIKSSIYQFQFSQFESKKQSIVQQSMIQDQVDIRPSKVYFDQQSNKFNSHQHISQTQIEQQTLQQIKTNRRIELDKQQLQFDQMKEYNEYMPQNNFSLVLKLYEKTINKKKNLNRESYINKYSFFYYVKNMVIKIKKKEKFAFNCFPLN